MKLVIDESKYPSKDDTQVIVHRGAALMGYRFSHVEIHYLRSPVSKKDLEWLNHACINKVLPK